MLTILTNVKKQGKRFLKQSPTNNLLTHKGDLNQVTLSTHLTRRIYL